MNTMRITKAVAAVLLVVGLVSVTTGIVLATQSTLQQDRHQVNALIFVGVGALLVFDAVILLLRSRAPVIPVTPDFDLGASSGPFGLDGPRALDITRVYRLNHGVLTIAVTGATVVFLSTATALRIQPSLLSGVVGAAIGLALSAYIALALQRSSLEVGPGGITVNGFRMRTPIPWTAVESIGVQKGRCIVRVRNSATSRNPVGIRNRDFSAYLRVPDNASMPGLIAKYLSERDSAPATLVWRGGGTGRGRRPGSTIAWHRPGLSCDHHAGCSLHGRDAATATATNQRWAGAPHASPRRLWHPACRLEHRRRRHRCDHVCRGRRH